MKTRDINRKRASLFIHIAGWVIIFGLPLLFSDHASPDYLQHYLRLSLIPLTLLIVFYVNYGLLIDKFLFKKEKPIAYFFVFNIILILGISLIMYAVRHYYLDTSMPPHPEGFIQALFGFFFRDLIPLVLAAGMSIAVKMTNRWIFIEKELETVEREKVEAELKTLKSQINPHFLFNTLNNIYSLITLSPEKAQQAIIELSKLMRYVLYGNTPRYVPLSKEMDFIHNYVELMRLRLASNTELSISLPIGENSIEVAPLLFISLIENAFKHGVSNTLPSFVHIDISVEGDHIICHIENSNFPKGTDDKSGSGIGLDNLRKRLDILYPDQYTFEITENKDTYCSVLDLLTQPVQP
ncbi:MAG: histidine kinase [Porphyromonadaceae bacterium]|nr:histidine kinase [Porphyromonadaceae bacterium]